MVGGPSSEVGHSCNTALPLGPLSTSTPPHAVLLVLAPACEISMTVPRPGVERQKGPDLLSMSLRALALSRVSPSTSHSARRNTPFPVETKARWHLLRAVKCSPNTDTCIALPLNSQPNGPKQRLFLKPHDYGKLSYIFWAKKDELQGVGRTDESQQPTVGSLQCWTRESS